MFKASINHYNHFIASLSKTFQMQNITNSYLFYLPNGLPCYAYLPITPSHSDNVSPLSDYPYSPSTSMVFPSHLDSFYTHQSSIHPPQDNPSSPQQIGATKIECDQAESGSKAVQSPVKALTGAIAAPPTKTVGVGCLKREQQSPAFAFKGPQSGSRKEKKRSEKVEVDQDYYPEGQRGRKYCLKYQVNENRNVVPNQINQIFSFVQKQNKSGHLVAKLFNKYRPSQGFSIKRFYQYQALLKNRLGHYANEKSLRVIGQLYEPKCENWSELEQRYYNKICRVLIHHFMHEDSVFIILTSKRMKSEKKADHLRARRQIALSVGDILKGF